MKLGLKANVYANLAIRNLWLLGLNEKVRNYLRYRFTPHRAVIDTRRAAPVFMTINVTRRCNMSCRFCIVGDVLNTNGWRPYESSLDRVTTLLAHPVARRCLYVMLTGGEPLLNEEVVSIVRLIKRHRHLVSINTNGLLLDAMVEDLRMAGLDMLNISHYDENHEALAAMMPSACRGIYTKLLRIIGRDDLDDPRRIDDVLRLARESSCRRVFFQNTYPHVDGLAKEREIPLTLEPTGRESRPIGERDVDAYEELQAEMRARYPDVSVFWPAHVPDTIRAGMKECRMPWYLFVVDTAGNLGFCSAYASCTGPNIYDLPVEDVLNTEDWVSRRRQLLSDDTTLPDKCRGCYTIHDSWRRDM